MRKFVRFYNKKVLKHEEIYLAACHSGYDAQFMR